MSEKGNLPKEIKNHWSRPKRVKINHLTELDKLKDFTEASLMSLSHIFVAKVQSKKMHFRLTTCQQVYKKIWVKKQKK